MAKNNDTKKVVLTGGHAGSTAYVVIEEIRKQNKNWDLYWIGSKSSIEGAKVAPISSIYFPKYGIKTYGIIAGRLQRKFTLHTVPSLLKIPIGFIHAIYLLAKIKPDVVLSFGGFSAFPVVVVAGIFGIPVIIHEQTSVVGRANKYSATFSKRIAISRDTSARFFPKEKTLLTGNPTPYDIKSNLKNLPKIPAIFITGGQSGSVVINDAVESALPKLLKDFRVVHLTGIRQEDKFRHIWEKLDSKLKERYKVYGQVDFKKYSEIFNSSTLLISRAGANTVSKILVSKKPSILIPLPISYLNEQEKNAIYAKNFGLARVLLQDDLTPESLLDEVFYLIENWNEILDNVSKKETPDVHAAEKLVSLIEEELK